MERRYDSAVRRSVVSAAATGASIRGNRDGREAVAEEAVRVVCRRCRRRLDRFRDPAVVYGQRWNSAPAARKTWVCACGGNYPVTLARMLAEYAAAVERADLVILLPLPRLEIPEP